TVVGVIGDAPLVCGTSILALLGSGAVFPINGSFRDECMNESLFSNLAEAKNIIESWRKDYNTTRPHTSLGGIAPADFARQLIINRPASPELRNGSAQLALTGTKTSETNVNGSYP
ncbi:MAG: transposase, partial [Rhodobacteraceae bacterium]|nr:transposase [Paracoccaceae bacterium]